MIIHRVQLRSFRNYESIDLHLGEKINLLCGDNAQGKTNLLEALYVCGTTRSFRHCPDNEMIMKNESEAHIQIESSSPVTDTRIDIHLVKNERKKIFIDQLPVKKASQLIGKIKFIVFSPDDMALIKGGPSVRRNFLNLEISQIEPVYLSDLSKYNHILRQRNQLLKDIKKDQNLKKTLDIWDEQIILYGCGIIKERMSFINKMDDVIKNIHRRLTEDSENIEIVYKPSVSAEDYRARLKRARERDLLMATTTAGPHRDDFTVNINGSDSKAYGSQGQKRTAALSIKLSEIELLRQQKNEEPVILLDDVFSELDQKRQRDLLSMIGDYQTIITCTQREPFFDEIKADKRLFYVKEGQIKEIGGTNGTGRDTNQ